MCRRADRKRRCLPANVANATNSTNAAWVAVGTEFRERDQVLENMDTFKYLVIMLCIDNSDSSLLSGTSRECGGNGNSYQACWDWRGLTPVPLGCSTYMWSSIS